MNITIKIYLILSISMVFFNLCFVIFKSLDTFKIKQSKNNANLRKIKNLVGITDKNQRKDEILALINTYYKRNDTEKAYYMYVLSTFSYETKFENQDFILKYLESPSIYVISNTMDAIFAIGDEILLLKAIETLSNKATFYHKKLITDGLIKFKGDKKFLSDLILAHLSKYNVEIQVALIDFLRIDKIVVENVDFTRFLTFNKELKYSTLRLLNSFESDNYDEIYVEILMNDDDWIAKMLALQGIKDKSKKFRFIQKYAYSSNFNLRKVAVNELFKDFGKQEINQIMQKDDIYTNEAIFYLFENEKRIMKRGEKVGN